MSGIPTQSVGGLISGFDTANIIKSLMSIERRPVTQLENKKQEIEAQKKAFQSFNSMLLNFKSNIDILGRSSSYNIKTASSSNESILTADALSGAALGSFTFKVARMAQAHQVLSNGFSDTNTSPVGAGTITIDQGGASLSRSTKLASLNGETGVKRGSINITDRVGNTTTIDLSAAETVQDVINSINANQTINVSASINTTGEGFQINDLNALPTGNLIIEDSSTGQTATDLGINTGALGVAGNYTGSSVYYLAGSNSLAQLNDGLGIDDGTYGTIRLTDTITATNYDLNLSSASTVQDVITAINGAGGGVFTATASNRGLSITNVLGNTFTVSNDITDTTDKTATDLGIAGASVGNVLNGSDLVGELDSVMVANISGKSGIGIGLGTISITDRSGGGPVAVNLGGSRTLNDIVQSINASGAQVQASINNVGNGIVVKDTSGLTASNLIITDTAGTSAADLGITVNAAINKIDGGDIDRKYISRATALADLNGGEGFFPGSIRLTDANGATSVGDLSTLKTMGEVVGAINLAGLQITAQINATGDGIELINTKGSGDIKVEEVGAGSTAADLRMLGSAVGGASLNASFEETINIDANDTLNDVVLKLASSQTRAQGSILNDGSGINQYHLNITSDNSGLVGQMLIDTNISGLTFTETTTAQDALMLYGSGGSGVSPILLASSQNTFRNVIPGMNLTAQSASLSQSVTVNVKRDTDTLSTTFSDMVQSYNDMNDLASVLTRWDAVNQVPGLLFGDSQVPNILNEVQDLLMTTVSGLSGGISQLYDIGVKFKYDTSAEKTSLTLDSSVLQTMLDTEFDSVRDLMTQSLDQARTDQDTSIKVSNAAGGGSNKDNLINGNTSSGDFPATNGYQGTAAVNNDSIEINFGSAKSIYQLILHHIDSATMPAKDYAISDFTVEYWDTFNQRWKTAREYTANQSALNYISLPPGTKTDKIKLTVTGTNAPDNLTRLVEVEAMESQGAASLLKDSLSSMTDNVTGIFAIQQSTYDDKLSDLDTTIANMEDRLNMREIQLNRQFASMESALAQLQSQSDFFSAQMGALNTKN